MITLNMLRTNAYSRNQNVPNLATPIQVMAVASLMAPQCGSRHERLSLLGYWFERVFTSSKELSRQEASAILELGFTEDSDWEPNEDFLQFIDWTKEQL